MCKCASLPWLHRPCGSKGPLLLLHTAFQESSSGLKWNPCLWWVTRPSRNTLKLTFIVKCQTCCLNTWQHDIKIHGPIHLFIKCPLIVLISACYCLHSVSSICDFFWNNVSSDVILIINIINRFDFLLDKMYVMLVCCCTVARILLTGID